jgi:hypothetical protein
VTMSRLLRGLTPSLYLGLDSGTQASEDVGLGRNSREARQAKRPPGPSRALPGPEPRALFDPDVEQTGRRLLHKSRPIVQRPVSTRLTGLEVGGGGGNRTCDAAIAQELRWKDLAS